jgi:hypothetical protein
MSDFTDVAAEYIEASKAITSNLRKELQGQGAYNSSEFERFVEAQEVEDELYRMLRKQARDWDCEDAFVARFLSSS